MLHRRTIPLRLAVLLLTLTPLKLMGGAFVLTQKYPIGAVSLSAVIADVNGDGKPDLVFADLDFSSAGVMLGNGDGTFQPEVRFASGGQEVSGVAVADLNNDGKLDIVVANGDTNTVGVLLGNGDGTFQPVQTYASGGASLSILAADVNRDGNIDVIVSNSDNKGMVAVLLGNGDGTLRTPNFFGSGTALAIAVADVNGDGNPDLLVAEIGAAGVMLGNGDGTFKALVNYTAGSNRATSITAADVNGDHKPDLLVTFGECGVGTSCAPGKVAVYLGNGDGTFKPFVEYATGAQNALAIAAADINHDGTVDLVVANLCALNSSHCTGAGVVSVLRGRGDGTFKAPQTFTSGGTRPDSVAVADVNGDNKPDVVVINEFKSYFHTNYGIAGVLLNNIP